MFSRLPIWFAVSFVPCSIFAAQDDGPHDWVSDTGSTVRATLVRSETQTVYVLRKEDGTEVKVPENRLSEESRTAAERLLAARRHKAQNKAAPPVRPAPAKAIAPPAEPGLCQPDPPDAIPNIELAPGEKLVAQFSGKGVGQTTPFKVADDWRIEWKSKDDPEERLVWRIEHVAGRGDKAGVFDPEGLQSQEWVREFSRGGIYSLRVGYHHNPDVGLWRIRIIQGSGKIDP